MRLILQVGRLTVIDAYLLQNVPPDAEEEATEEDADDPPIRAVVSAASTTEVPFGFAQPLGEDYYSEEWRRA